VLQNDTMQNSTLPLSDDITILNLEFASATICMLFILLGSMRGCWLIGNLVCSAYCDEEARRQEPPASAVAESSRSSSQSDDAIGLSVQPVAEEEERQEPTALPLDPRD